MAVPFRHCSLLLPVVILAPLLAAAPQPPAAPVAPVAPPKGLPAPKGYVCVRAAAPPAIDGKLDDPAWQAAPWSDDFADIEGDARPKPRHRTRMKMTWDDTALYIAAELAEPHVWATIDQHDAVIFHDPDFEVFLDPDGDNHLYAEVEVNAKNTTWDLLLTKPYKDGGKAIDAWEVTGLKTAVRVIGTLNDPRDTDTGWAVEMAWPWAGLKELTGVAVPPRDGDQWRVNFSRVEWDFTVEGGQYVKVKGRPEHNWVWSPQGVIDMHRPERWGYVQFSTAAGPPPAYRPDPARAVQDALHEVYYAQRQYHKAHGRFAATAAELGVRPAAGVPDFTLTRRGFEATLTAPPAAGGKRWGITDDALLWSR